jgi:hypothetical protein
MKSTEIDILIINKKSIKVEITSTKYYACKLYSYFLFKTYSTYSKLICHLIIMKLCVHNDTVKYLKHTSS